MCSSTFLSAAASISGPCSVSPARPSPTRSFCTAATSFCGERLVHALLHQQPVRADAGLAGVAVLAGDRARDRRIEVGVVEHDERRVAAELERHLLHRPRALRHQQLADLGRAGEGQLAHARIARQHAADLARGPGDDVEDARRDAGARGELGERERGVGRLRRRLAHDRAAGGERGRDLAGDHRGREVPRRDRRDDADRLAQHEDALVRLVAGDHVAVDALRFLGEPLDEATRHRRSRPSTRRAACPARRS